jgi:hypothetical protein
MARNTVLSLASELASDAIARSTQRQLTLMALCDFLEEIYPKRPLPDKRMFFKWLKVHLAPFDDFEFDSMDAKHLVATACASFDPTSDRPLRGPMLLKAGVALAEQLLKVNFEDVPEIAALQSNWDMGLAGVQLTSVGMIVGGLALGQIKGLDLGPPGWS